MAVPVFPTLKGKHSRVLVNTLGSEKNVKLKQVMGNLIQKQTKE